MQASLRARFTVKDRLSDLLGAKSISQDRFGFKKRRVKDHKVQTIVFRPVQTTYSNA